MRIHYAALATVACLLGGQFPIVCDAAQVAEPVAQPHLIQPQVDNSTVLRFDPFSNKLVNVPPPEIKPGHLYNRYSERMGRRVWSLALRGGGFEYAMAPGSTQPARLLDLRATQQQLREELLERAPEMAQTLDIRGGTAQVRLTSEGTWEVVQQPTIACVFDLETSRRWEWHGVRRVAIMHTLGYEWSLVDGRFVPAVTSIVGGPGYASGVHRW